jgi:hypothetical protein
LQQASVIRRTRLQRQVQDLLHQEIGILIFKEFRHYQDNDTKFFFNSDLEKEKLQVMWKTLAINWALNKMQALWKIVVN